VKRHAISLSSSPEGRILQINSYRFRLAPSTVLGNWGKIAISLWGPDRLFTGLQNSGGNFHEN
jgi:hypothetical protein